METTKKRNGFASGIGFILAAAGSAVGLGNLWSFPYKTSANGGAAFVFVYILSSAIIGSIVMLSEIYLNALRLTPSPHIKRRTKVSVG